MICREVSDLKARLDLERKENSELSKSVQEQQGVIRTALKRINPSLEVEGCQEHQDRLDAYLAKNREGGGNPTELCCHFFIKLILVSLACRWIPSGMRTKSARMEREKRNRKRT